MLSYLLLLIIIINLLTITTFERSVCTKRSDRIVITYPSRQRWHFRFAVLRSRRVSVRKRIASGRRPAKRDDRRGQCQPERHCCGGRPSGPGRIDVGRKRPSVASAPGLHTSDPDTAHADKRRGHHTDQARAVTVAERTTQPDHHQSAIARRLKWVAPIQHYRTRPLLRRVYTIRCKQVPSANSTTVSVRRLTGSEWPPRVLACLHVYGRQWPMIDWQFARFASVGSWTDNENGLVRPRTHDVLWNSPTPDDGLCWSS